MSDRAGSEDYAVGYADGVRDAAAWTGRHADRLRSLAAYVDGDDAPALRDAVLALHDAAHRRWAQWSDRRNWPDVRALVARARSGAGRGG